jgi:predicted nucleic acid-binding protein
LLYSEKQLQVCVSFVALGELVNEVATQRKRLDLQEIARILEDRLAGGYLVTYGLGDPSTSVFESARELRGRERELTPCDAMIVACAIEDPDCDVLYTFDRLLLESPSIRQFAASRSLKVKPVEES